MRALSSWEKMTAVGHGHSHSADDGMHGGWGDWLESTRLRGVMGGLGVALIAAVIGLVLLWPTGEGTTTAIEAAAEIGLATERVTANVVSSENADCSYSTQEFPQTCRLLVLDITEGPDAGSVLALPEINLDIERGIPEFEPGDGVILALAPATNTYFYEDQIRTIPILALTILFAIIVVVFGRLRGVFALLAMAITVVVLVGFVAPSVLDGNDPILVALVAATLIAFFSLFLTHGFSPTTAVALAGTLSALLLTFVLSFVFFGLSRFTGFESSEALVLPALNQDLRLSSLLLGGAIIGALGALDDVTVTQVSLVAELRRQSPSLPSSQLISSSLSVGRDHIAATVNTLLLAYAGASLPLLLLFAASDQSLASVASSEVIAVEIVRTLCGSIGLIGAVPLTTLLAVSILPATNAVATATTSVDKAATPQVPDVDKKPNWDDFAPDDFEVE